MSSARKCKNCGSSSIEVDPARGDAVCTSCGSVLEDNIIVAEVEFQENTHGGASAIGQFVSAESKGGATGFGASFHMGIGTESREVTIRKAKQGITALSQQLRLNQHCIDIACNFFKMALGQQFTKGRPASHMHAACVYITCRTEGTPHLLIDISDVLQICCYQLGRTYLRLSKALCINIPSIDPCLYILRFANKLEFGDKTHEVTNTALRLVQRMKRDSLHSGRRPSGLCGAALLIAARLHEFSRSPNDVVRIVKVHESTLRKRMMEFGETPSSALTLEEFLTVDLEQEQDPPSFKAARRRDKERLQKLEEEGGETVLTQLQKEIDLQLSLETKRKTRATPASRSTLLDQGENEEQVVNQFVMQSNLEAVEESLVDDPETTVEITAGLGPDLGHMLGSAPHLLSAAVSVETPTAPSAPAAAVEIPEEVALDDVDDEEISSIIMSERDVRNKTELWYKSNAGYLMEQKIKAERIAKEREEGKPEKKKRKPANKKKGIGPSASAGEAIEKMLQEKKISTKINYDILKSLSSNKKEEGKAEEKVPEAAIPPSPSWKRPADVSTSQLAEASSPAPCSSSKRSRRAGVSQGPLGLPTVEAPSTNTIVEDASKQQADEYPGEYYEDESDVPEASTAPEMQSLSHILQSQYEEQDDYYEYC